MTTGKKRRKPSKHQALISSLLKDPKSCSWPNEMRIAGILLKKYDFDLLLSLKDEFKVISLTWFLGDRGKDHLNKKKNYQKLKLEKQTYKLEDKPVAPKSKVVRKSRTLQDFLNIFK
jgi:ADP-heptose:LPS heptosyltransferase